MKKTMTTKKGAASFYIVIFVTLILTVVALSFVRLVLSEMKNTTNNDLAQSAYDSALAGIEDAKIALLDYNSCANQGYTAKEPNGDSTLTCEEIIYYMEQAANDCDSVSRILGRIAPNESGKEVVINEKSGKSGATNNMNQAYTCVKMASILEDYRASLTQGNITRVIPVRTTDVNNVEAIRVSWYSETDGTTYNYENSSSGGVVFKSLSNTKTPTPPVVSVSVFQTAEVFYLDQIDMTYGSTTDRATVFLVPSSRKSSTRFVEDTYIDITNNNHVTTSDMLKSNDKTSSNKPFLVHCESGSEFACSAILEVPDVVGSANRSADTFMIVVSLPYATPDTDFSVQLCSQTDCSDESILTFNGVQLSIDSTGRANNLYRRVETRLETSDYYFPYPDYAVYLSGTANTINKNFYSTKEYNFGY